MKTFSKVALAAVFALVAGFATAQPLPPAGPNPEAMLKKLGLTEDQTKQVGDLWTKEQTALDQQRAQLKVYNAQIEQAMVAPKTDLAAVNALVDKRTQLRAEMEKSLLATEAEVHQIVGDQLFLKVRQVFLKHHRFGAWAPGKAGDQRQRMGWNRPLNP